MVLVGHEASRVSLLWWMVWNSNRDRQWEFQQHTLRSEVTAPSCPDGWGREIYLCICYMNSTRGKRQWQVLSNHCKGRGLKATIPTEEANILCGESKTKPKRDTAHSVNEDQRRREGQAREWSESTRHSLDLKGIATTRSHSGFQDVEGRLFV